MTLGKCLVHKCQENWAVSADGHSCEASNSILARHTISSPGGSMVNKKAGSSKTDAFLSAGW